MTDIEEVAKNITERLTSGAEIVFGESRELGDKTVITVSKVMYGLGGGGGREKDESSKIGEGSGMGMGVKIIPVGYITVTKDEVTYQPLLDLTKIITMAIGLVGCLSLKLIKRRSH